MKKLHAFLLSAAIVSALAACTAPLTSIHGESSQWFDLVKRGW
jgi:hypothetical protein